MPSDPWQYLRALMAPVLEKLPHSLSSDDMKLMQQAMIDVACNRARAFMAGLRLYQGHDVSRDFCSAPVVWQKGSTSLRLYAPTKNAESAPALLVVPSLVNRFDIMDLDEDHSFLRFMASKGLRVFVVDWDAPAEEEQEFSLSDYMTKRLFPILDFVKTENKNVSPVVIGYCMGGVMSVALAVHRPKDVAALALLAAPWDFAYESHISQSLVTMIEKMEPVFQACKVLPVPLLQSMFIGHQPIEVLGKYLRFANQDPQSRSSRRFVLTEDWLNDGVPLSAEVAKDCLRDWYGKNVTGRNEWGVAGKTISPRELDLPSYVIIPQKDRVVRPESAQALADQLTGAIVVKPDLGHIGLMASPKAVSTVWEPLAVWVVQKACGK